MALALIYHLIGDSKELAKYLFDKLSKRIFINETPQIVYCQQEN
jgi:hypothetical protein